MVDYVFKPSNVLTFETVQADSRRLHKLLNSHQNVTCIRFDLAEVKHCDSTGLALLIEAKRLCNRRKLSFILEHMSDSLSGLAEFCEVDKVLS